MARARLQWTWTWHALLARLLGSLAALVMAVGWVWSVYGDFAPMMRNDRSLRYQITPFNAWYSDLRALQPKIKTGQRTLQPVGQDAQVRPTKHPSPLLIVVVGETARAANFGLGGYSRNTTPHMQRRMAQGQMVYWSQAQSCGTNTEVSLPCMFSPLTRAEGADQNARHHNLLDVLTQAGVGVYWIDNQSGSKGVADRVPTITIGGHGDPRWCSHGECFDEALIQHLDQALGSLSSAQKQRGAVLVLHQMGSHGPAYFKRSPADAKPFAPECKTNVLAQCSPQALRNTYDNSIAYTDHVLEQALRWLELQERGGQFAPSLIYASDHGESLGEKGMFLHGAPRWMAPSEQTHIPLLAWYSKTWARTRYDAASCLRRSAEQPINHDFIFHSVLGLMNVQTQAYVPALDWHTACLDP